MNTDQEFETIQNVMNITKQIMIDVRAFWEKHARSNPESLKSDETVNKLTKDLYGILKEKYAKFHAAYSLFLFPFCRSIYNEDELLKYFDKVRRRGTIGTDKEQIEDVATYISKTVSIQHERSTGKKVPKKDKKKHKELLIKNMTEAREAFTDVLKEIQEAREQKKNVPSGQEDTKEEDPMNEEILSLFRDTKPYETNELFAKSVQRLRESGQVSGKDDSSVHTSS